MKKEGLHVTDEELLLHGEGEIRSASSHKIKAHVESCAQCQARLTHLESTLASFGEVHRMARNEELPPAEEQRGLLQTRLADLAAKQQENVWSRVGSVLAGHRQAVVFASAAVALCCVLAVTLRRPLEGLQPISQRTRAPLSHLEEPNLRLTPGAIVAVTSSDVCGAAAAKAVPPVPVSLERRVFEEYGVTPPQPGTYEVDYLITPELGGATDIRNLWPEPYRDTVWNAHVKDQLEDRLHSMVCRGDIDLATAQRDIATDWIAAYRKYFHADRPVSEGPSFDSSSLTRSLPRT